MIPDSVVGRIVLITYNSATHLPGLLRDLEPLARSGEYSVTVVDNGSQDGTLAVLRAVDWVRLIQAPENPGYAGAINRARADGPAGVPTLILNPDVRIPSAAVRALFTALERPGVGIAAPTIEDPDGTTHPSLRREPSLLTAVGDAVLGSRVRRRPGRFSELIRNTADYPQIDEVAWATGAVLAVSADCDRAVGDWDSGRFFLYSEETDYCRRARACGFSVVHVPDAVAMHVGAGSGDSAPLQALQAVNRVRYYRKHHPRPAAWAFRVVVALHALARLRRPGQRRALGVLCGVWSAATLPGGRPGAL